MDFKKIARIFIIAFSLLNIYLIISIYERQDIHRVVSDPSTNNVLESMAELNIEVTDVENLDTEIEDIFALQINAHQLLEDEIEAKDELTGSLNDDGTVYYESFPSNPINLEGNPTEGFTPNDYDLMETFVASNEVMFGDEYEFLRYDDEGRRFIFNQFVDGIPIADGSSEISFYVNDSGEIYAFQQTYAGPASRQGNELSLIEALRAIEILFVNNEIQEGAQIDRPVLAYHRVLHLEDISMYSPVWLVDIDQGNESLTYRVDAVNGTIIRQPIAPPTNVSNPNESEPETEDDEEAENEEDSGAGE